MLLFQQRTSHILLLLFLFIITPGFFEVIYLQASSGPEVKRKALDLGREVRGCRDPLNDAVSTRNTGS